MWDGKTPVRWRKLENFTLELPRDTLLSVEIVQELKGEVRGCTQHLRQYILHGAYMMCNCRLVCLLERPHISLMNPNMDVFAPQGKAQRRINAVHVMDALILNGTDVRDQHFNQR